MKRNGNGFYFESFFGRILSPFERFLKQTTAGGIILILAVAAGLVCANFGPLHLVSRVWELPFRVGFQNVYLEMTFHAWINDGLMTLFFFSVGLELKRELMVGELSSFKDAILPIIAAFGGMVVPAAIYLMLNPHDPAARGWGVPIATDIAFAVGILVLLGRRVPPGLVVFLTALAIADDLGAVAVIAFFYTGHLQVLALLAAALLLLFLFVLNRGGIRHPFPYALLGVFLWFAMLKSGIHPTIAGILLACAIPAKSAFTPPEFAVKIEQLQEELYEESFDPSGCDHAINCPGMASVAENLEKAARAVQSPLQRLEHSLGPWVTFLILPLFAFSNLGIDFSKISLNVAFGRIALGVALGLVFGKFIGISLFSWLAVTLKIAKLPNRVTWTQMLGIGWLGGIGLTMSLFISNLAFGGPVHLEEAKIGILVASAVAAPLGLAWLYRLGRKSN
ncbi:MAG: Na+/H+ antiporter NhaA [Syntrophobacteraceae bacterium]